MGTETACTKSEIDLYRPIDVQVALTDGRFQTYYPINSLASSHVIDFLIPGTSNEVIDMNNISIYVRGKFTKADGGELVAADTLVPANNLLHTMIRSCDVCVNGQLLTRASKDYAYKDYLTKLTQVDMPRGGRKESQLIMEGFYLDDAGDPAAAANTTLAERKKIITTSKAFELCGPLAVDLFQCDRSLIMGSDISLKIQLNDPAFYMIDNNATTADRITPKLVLESVELYVRRVTVADTFVNALNSQLKVQDAIYPYTRREIQAISMPSGTTTFTRENLFRGQLAVRYFFAMVHSRHYAGLINASPFYFQNFGISEIALMENGQNMTQSAPLKMDFTTANQTRVVNAYHLFLESIGAVGDRALNCPIDLARFCNGFTVFCFTRSPDLTHGCNHLPNQTGNLTLQLNFATATSNPIVILCMAEFDSRIQINEHRNIVTDFAV